MSFFNNTSAKLSIVLKARSGSEYYSKKILLVILFFGLLSRICISFFISLPNIHTDSIDYFQQADTLLKGGYTNFFPNGYPFIVALVKISYAVAIACTDVVREDVVVTTVAGAGSHERIQFQVLLMIVVQEAVERNCFGLFCFLIT